MTIYLIAPLVQIVLCLILIAVVLAANFNSLVNRLFALFLLGLVVWAVFIFGMRSSPALEHAYVWEQWLAAVGTINATVLFHFVIRFVSRKVPRWLLPLLYSLNLLILVLTPTGLTLSGMQVKSYGFAPVFGPLWLAVLPLSFLLSFVSLGVLINSFRASLDAEHRNRISYIVIAIIIMMIGGIFDVLPLFGLPLYPGLIIGNIIFCLVTTGAIVQHRLLDIRFVLRRGLAYFLTSAIITLPFVALFLLATTFLIESGYGLLTFIFIVLVMAIVVPPIWRWMQERVDKWFYRERYSFLKALEFFRNTQSIDESGMLSTKICELIVGSLQAESVYLLLQNPATGSYNQAACASPNKNAASGIALSSRSALVRWLNNSDSIIPEEDLDVIPQLQSLSPADKELLEKIKVRLIVPMKTRSTGRLLGLLFLGPKSTRLPYFIEDRQLLTALCNQVVTDLDNVRLYDEAKKSESALRESEEKLRRMFESVTDAITVFDLKGIVTDCNEGAVKATRGACRSQVLGQKAIIFIPPSELERMKQEAQKQVFDGGVGSVTGSIRRFDGTEYPAEISVSALHDDNGAPIGYVALVRDITERKQMEETRREYEQKAYIASRLATTGEMAAGIAHEINNPLTGVIGFSQILMQKEIPDDIKKDIQIIYSGAQRVASIVNRMLTFARQQKPERRWVNIHEIINNTLELRTYSLKANNIAVITDFDPNLPPTLADAGQLQQVFLNLIINAETEMRLAHNRGNLVVKTEAADSIIRISFADDGPGIAEENMKRLFEPFFTTREVGQGTGLGLSICHGIVTEHGGKIYARSKFGAGATFFVELPAGISGKSKEQQNTVFDTKLSGRKAKMKILVIDDEPMVQQFLNRILSAEEYEVEMVYNANDGLQKLITSGEDYNVVILDVKLPGMSGIELFNHLQKEAPSLTRKVLIVTGDVIGTETQDFLLQTKTPYLAKPFNTDQLREALRKIISPDGIQ